MEYAYSEQVKVVDGMCDVIHLSTRDYLLKVGYEEMLDQEPVGVGVTADGSADESVKPPAQSVPSMRASSKKHGNKKKR